MRASPYCTFDDSHWPLRINRFVGEALNHELEDFLTQETRFLLRGQSHVLLVDLSRAGNLPPEHRQRLAEWLRQHDALIQRMVLGMAYVTPTAPVRLALSVLFHLRKLPVPHILSSREDQALLWAINRLEAVGLHAPAGRIRRDLGLMPEHRAG